MAAKPRDPNDTSRPPADDATVPFTPPPGGSDRADHPHSDPEAETSAVPTDPAATTPHAVNPMADAPESIEGYRMMGRIGRGGMGTVYLAQRLDDRFQKRVAIKVMRRGMDTDEMLERFKLERQVLGALNHPNIARLYDAGATSDGRPYFVMEHVEGVPIDDYCDEHNLPVQDRVKIFTKVCGAVHYAHQNLIVHRDLKPSNILVTAEGEPKLLDFGIAKLLNPGLLGLPALTRADQRIMTYEYASPEQVQGQQITTASDVYALGVILYELLTGHRPYQIERRVHAEAVRVICEEEPHRPSTAVSRAATRHTTDGQMHTITAAEIAKRREAQITRLKRNLAGDLDNVILMAMRKSAQRRYSTAQALADDLVRHLEGQTVTARAPTFGYRAGKFLRRNKAAVTAAALVALAITLGFAATTWAWQRSETALERESIALVAARDAEQSERDARIAAETRYLQLRQMFTIEDELYEQIENLPGATAARNVLTDAMLTAIGSLSASFPDDARLRRDLAVQYRRIGSLAAGGENSLARGVEALETARTLLAGAPATDEERLIVGVKLANALWRAGQRDRAVTIASETADLAASVAGNPDAPPRLNIHHADALIQTAIVRTFRARYDDAADLLVAAIGLASEAVEQRPDDPEAVRSLAHAHEMLGVLNDHRGLKQEELVAHLEALTLRRRVTELDPENTDARRRLVMSNERVGRALMALDRLDEAEPYFETMRALAEAETDADPFSGRALDDLARSFENAGDLAVKLRQYDAAEPLLNAFLDTSLALLGRDPLELNNRRSVALARYKLGFLHYQHARALRTDDPDRALALYASAAESLEAAVADLRVITDDQPADTLLRSDLFLALRWLGYTRYRHAQAVEGDKQTDLYEQGHRAFAQALAEAAAYRDAGGDTASLESQIYAAANGLCNIAYRTKRGDRMVAAADAAHDLMAEPSTTLLGQRALGLDLMDQTADALATVRLALATYEGVENPESSGAYRRLKQLETEYQTKLDESTGAFDD